MREKKPSHISQTIKEVFENIDPGGTAGAGKDNILSAWYKAAGSKAAKHSSPAALKDETLLVNVDSTAWIYQLRLKEQDLLKKISRLLKKQKIQKIRFRAGLPAGRQGK